MTLAQINSRISFLTGTTVSEYTYNDRTLSLNKWYYQIQTWILQSQDEWDFDDLNNTTFPIATTDTVSNQGDYSMPSGTLGVKRVRINYGNGYVVAVPFDLPASTIANPNTEFSTSNPRYDMIGSSIFLYPSPTSVVSAGLEVTIDRGITPFTYTSEASNDLLTGTKTPGIDANFHDMLAKGAEYEWKATKLQDKSGMQEILLEKQDLQNHYSSKQKDRSLSLGSSFVDYN